MTVSRGLIARIREEFADVPGLKITIAQACRLWDVQESVAREALDELVRDGFLFETPSGAFIALPSASRMLKAEADVSTQRRRCPHCQHLNSPRIERTLRGDHIETTFRCVACGKIFPIDVSA